MLSAHDAMATVAVRDLDAARRFYGDVLGLQAGGHLEGVVTYRSGRTRLVVYESETGGQNPATSVTWDVGDGFDDAVAKLREAGVKLERYDLPGMTVRDGVHTSGDFKAVWFKDPDGNILHINNM